MIQLTEAAACLVGALLQADRVPALRVRATGPAFKSEAVAVETEQARRLGPGEVAVSCGAAIVYLPGWLAREHDTSLLDLAASGDSSSPGLVLRRRTDSARNCTSGTDAAVRGLDHGGRR